MKTRIFYFLILTASIVWGQDAQFSQFYVSALYLNPALAGQENGAYASTNYRVQWRSISSPYTSTQITGTLPIKSNSVLHTQKGGVGASFYTDKSGEGSLKTNNFNISGAYNLPLGKSEKSFLAMGLQVGLIQKSLDYSGLQWGSQYDPFIGYDANINPNEVNLKTSRLYADVNAGASWFYNKDKNYDESPFSSYLGGSVYHLTQPNESMVSGATYKLPSLIRAHGGVEFKVSPVINISPNFLVALQKQQKQFNLGSYVSFKVVDKSDGLFADGRFVIGGWYRLKDAGVALVGFSTKHYQLGFSYDFNTSDLRYNTKGKGAYEISFVLRKAKNYSLQRFSTPRF